MKIKATQKNWSSFWMDPIIDDEYRGIDYTKLAATQRAIGNFVNIVTGKQIPVVFQSNDRSYTDGEQVTIGSKLDDTNFDPTVGLALHEGSHIAYTDFSLFKDQHGNNTSLISNTKFASIVRFNGCDPNLDMTECEFDMIKNLLNWVEDRRIDYKVYTAAPGYRVYYQSMYDKYFNDAVIDKALKKNAKTQETWDDYLFHIINFTNPNRNLDALDKLRDIWKVIDLKNISRLTSTHDALVVACDVFKIIKATVKVEEEEQPEPQPTPSPNNNAGGGDGEQGESGEAGESSDQASNSEGGNASGEGGDESGDGDMDASGDDTQSTSKQDVLSDTQLKRLEKAIQSQKDFLDGKQQKRGRLSRTQSSIINAIKESGTEIRSIYTDIEKTNSIETIVIKKLTSSIITSMDSLFAHGSANAINNKPLSNWQKSEIEGNAQAVQNGIILGRLLGNKLQLRNADKTLKSTRLQTGKIDRRLVSQLGYDNANVFHRIVTERFKNYFIHISIDASGSMQGEKFRNALTSAVAIAQAASMTTGIRVQISLRGTSNMNSNTEKCVTMYAYDSARDKMSKIMQLFKYLGTYGCTPEGLSFKSIEQDIKSDAKGDEMIFINYSDGYPTEVAGCQRRYDGVEYTRRVVNDFRAIGIDVISYFITHTGGSWGGMINSEDQRLFKTMYGQDAQFIDPKNMHEVSRTMNRKFLEKVQ